MNHPSSYKKPETRHNLKLKASLLRASRYRLQDRGFTFVETLVAISILLMAIAAPLTLGSQGLAASRIARDQVIATYLAQEAIEYARNIRDTNTLVGNEWLQGLEYCIDAVCMIDVPAGVIEPCDSEKKIACDPLVFSETTGLYGLPGGGSKWIDTKFTRGLSITVNEKTINEALLVVTVSWKDGRADRSLSIEESIFDWQ